MHAYCEPKRLGALAALSEELELTLASLVTGALQTLQGLLAGLGGLAADDATGLVVLEILAGQTTGGVVGSAVHDLGAAANSPDLTTHNTGIHILLACVLASLATTLHHHCVHFLMTATKKT